MKTRTYIVIEGWSDKHGSSVALAEERDFEEDAKKDPEYYFVPGKYDNLAVRGKVEISGDRDVIDNLPTSIGGN